MRLPRLLLLAVSVSIGGQLHGASSLEDRVELLFRPPLGEMIALSPDGQRLAYTMLDGKDLTLVVMSLDPTGAKRKIAVDLERDPAAGETSPVPLRFLRWATGNRLIYAPAERIVPLPPVTDRNGRVVPNPDGPTVIAPVLATDADGKQRGTLIDAKYFQETPEESRRTLADLLRTTKELVAASSEPVRWRMPHLDILGFPPRDREHLIVQTRGAYSAPAQHLVDIRTGDVRSFGNSWPAPPGEPQVFDWFRFKVVGERKDSARPTTVWQDDELAGVQRSLEAKFPRRVVELLDWNETRTRVVARVTGGSDPGRVFVFLRPENLALQVLARAPWLTAAKLNETCFFEFAASDGARISGYVTWPKTTRVGAPPPLLVTFPSGFPGGAQPAFDPEAQVFADLGFAVARLNHRSVGGVRNEDLHALRESVDRVSIDDARATLDWLAAQHPGRPFDRKRVATLGRGFGGYLAIRALQVAPADFRCGVAIDAPMDLRPWVQAARGGAPTDATKPEIPAQLIEHEGANWTRMSVVSQAAALTPPVILLAEPGRRPAVDRTLAELRGALQALGRTPEQVELDAGFALGTPASRAAAYRRIEAFLAIQLQTHAVPVGPAKEVE